MHDLAAADVNCHVIDASCRIVEEQIARLQVVLDDIFPNFPIGSDVKLVIPVRVLHDASPLAGFVEQMHGLL